MGTVKDRNGMDLTEAEDIKKRWEEHTESAAFNLPANLENSAVATGLEKVSLKNDQSQRRAMPKNVQTAAQLHSSHTPAN